MNIARFSIKRPILISCLVIVMIVTGMIGLKRMGVDLLPPTDFPIIIVMTSYPGASPEEIESLISKPLEEKISTISGLKRLTSRNTEGASIVIAEFNYETDIKYAEQKMREKVDQARNDLPGDLENDPVVTQINIDDVPVVTMALTADLPPIALYDMAKETIKPMLEQVRGVGEVRLIGGTRREIQVELDRNKLNEYQISALAVAESLRISGVNIPVGKYDSGNKSTVFRTIGEFKSIDQINKSLVSFSGDMSSSVTISKLGTVRDDAEDVKTHAYLYFAADDPEHGKGSSPTGLSALEKKGAKNDLRQCILIDVVKQSGSNSVAVAEDAIKRIETINETIKKAPGSPQLVYVYDTSKYIRMNIDDVRETMIIGIILTILVVYLFLGNIRSTIITGIAIPNSILGAFVLMYFMGFTLNLMTLIALSLAVGLLVDDAIVVRENIFRNMQAGLEADEAAERGTREVMLAVVATTLTIISVFLPIAFLEGVVGRIFRQFGLVVVFAMLISLFDALTVAPLLSAYFGGKGEKAPNRVVQAFDAFQTWLDKIYDKCMAFCVDHPMVVILLTIGVFIASIGSFAAIGKTFQSESEETEFSINLELPACTSLEGTRGVAIEIAEKIKRLPELDHMSVQIGSNNSEDNHASIGVFLVPMEQRKRDSAEIKKEVREMLRAYSFAKPSVNQYGNTQRPYRLVLKGNDLKVLEAYSEKVRERMNKIKDITELDVSTQPGKPEFQVHLDEQKMQMLGVTHKMAGGELRYHVAGGVVGKFHDNGIEYDVRLRLKPEQRNLKSAYYETRVPNVHGRMIPVSAVSEGKTETGPSRIYRQDRSRVIQISANIAEGGAMGRAIEQTKQIFEKEMPLPAGVSYAFIGSADSFLETLPSMVMAVFLSIMFIYLILASLYESFITPFTILLALPTALSGAFFALFITGKHMDIFAMIGIIMLLGLVTKNSILLVDFAMEGVRSGLSRRDAIIQAGRLRLRPILMTTFAMLAGMLPMTIGVGPAGSTRASFGIAIMGGLIVSTFITLLVVPAVFGYIDRFREALESRFRLKKKNESASMPVFEPVPVPVNVPVKRKKAEK